MARLGVCRRRTVLLALPAATAALVLVLPLPPAHGESAASGERMTVDAPGAARLLAMVNDRRADAGAGPLVVDAALAQVAVAHSLDMGRAGRVWHNGALATAAEHAALRIAIFGENVVGAPGGVMHAEQLFLASGPHRRNMLDPRWVVAGFAVVRETDGYVWVTEDFGTAPGGHHADSARAPAHSSAARASRAMSRQVPVPSSPPPAAQPVPITTRAAGVAIAVARTPAVRSSSTAGAGMAEHRGPVTAAGVLAAGVLGALTAVARRRLRARAAGRPRSG